MNKITFIAGDATFPERATSGTCIIAHICNDIGAWGAGFVMAISMRWKQPKREYIQWCRTGTAELGRVQFVSVEDSIIVANMIAQHDIRSKRKVPPIRYSAVRKCLATAAEHARHLNASVHMPRIGCGLAGGSWGEIEPIIEDTLLAANIPTFVYDKPR